MSDHDATVAAVLAEALVNYYDEKNGSEAFHAALAAAPLRLESLYALAAENYAVVKLPEGVEAEHGSRLVPSPLQHHDRKWQPSYVIEATPSINLLRTKL